jgi:hypothetical protein
MCLAFSEDSFKVSFAEASFVALGGLALSLVLLEDTGLSFPCCYLDALRCCIVVENDLLSSSCSCSSYSMQCGRVGIGRIIRVTANFERPQCMPGSKMGFCIEIAEAECRVLGSPGVYRSIVFQMTGERAR